MAVKFQLTLKPCDLCPCHFVVPWITQLLHCVAGGNAHAVSSLLVSAQFSPC